MATYSKFPAIDAVLAKAAKTLADLEKQYSASLDAQKISESLLVEIKDYLGNLRSALDYLNAKIPGAGAYFPICDHPNDFVARATNIAPKVRSALEACQPYNKQEWLRWFSILNNKNKHVDLSPQKRSEQIETRVSHPTAGGVSWSTGVTFGPGVSVMGVPIDPRTQLPVPNNMVKTERITWVSFYFDNTGEFAGLPNGLSALPFLKDCFGKIVKIVGDVEATLP